MSKKVYVSVDLLRRLLKQAGLGNRRVKLGRWVIKRELGVVVGRESKVES